MLSPFDELFAESLSCNGPWVTREGAPWHSMKSERDPPRCLPHGGLAASTGEVHLRLPADLPMAETPPCAHQTQRSLSAAPVLPPSNVASDSHTPLTVVFSVVTSSLAHSKRNTSAIRRPLGFIGTSRAIDRTTNLSLGLTPSGLSRPGTHSLYPSDRLPLLRDNCLSLPTRSQYIKQPPHWTSTANHLKLAQPADAERLDWPSTQTG